MQGHLTVTMSRCDSWCRTLAALCVGRYKYKVMKVSALQDLEIVTLQDFKVFKTSETVDLIYS